MDLLQPIAYRGRLLAAATPERFFLADDLDRRDDDDPHKRMVIWMCDYAGRVLRGDLPGPYGDGDARRYARRQLIPAELAERRDYDAHRAARGLRVPYIELRAAQFEQLGRPGRTAMNDGENPGRSAYER